MGLSRVSPCKIEVSPLPDSGHDLRALAFESNFDGRSMIIKTFRIHKNNRLYTWRGIRAGYQTNREPL